MKTSNFFSKYNPFTLANGITFLGVVLAIISWTIDVANIYSFVFLILALSTDYFDGLVARKIEKKYPGKGVSIFGTIFDPFRDKIIFLRVIFLNQEMLLLFLITETISFLLALMVRRKQIILTKGKENNFVTITSKVITFLQGILCCLVFFVSREQITIIFIGIFCLSLIRIISYVSKNKRLNERLIVFRETGRIPKII